MGIIHECLMQGSVSNVGSFSTTGGCCSSRIGSSGITVFLLLFFCCCYDRTSTRSAVAEKYQQRRQHKRPPHSLSITLNLCWNHHRALAAERQRETLMQFPHIADECCDVILNPVECDRGLVHCPARMYSPRHSSTISRGVSFYNHTHTHLHVSRR